MILQFFFVSTHHPNAALRHQTWPNFTARHGNFLLTRCLVVILDRFYNVNRALSNSDRVPALPAFGTNHSSPSCPAKPTSMILRNRLNRFVSRPTNRDNLKKCHRLAQAICLFVALLAITPASQSLAQSDNTVAPAKAVDPFAIDNLVAWCIVPFDDRDRTPIERSEMLNRLGLKRYAYDYRANHIPTFDAEMEAIKKHGIELTAWWFPTSMTDEARLILDVLKRHNVKTQLWVTGGGAATNTAQEQAERVQAEAARIAPIADAAAEIGCRVSLYNHGGWFGEPENQIEIIKALNRPNVGIVYNLHHGHDHLDRFPELLKSMMPYLDCLNLNGMVKAGDKTDKKILPIGDGDLETDLIKIIIDSGYQGPIGILNHTQENAETRLRKNLDGLKACLKTIAEKENQNPSSSIDTSHYSAEAVEQILAQSKQHGDATRGVSVFASANFACINCHRIGRHGGNVGPDLGVLATKRKPDEIVESIHWPQRTVPAEYKTIAVIRTDGQVIRGYEISRNQSALVIRDPATETIHEILSDDIEDDQVVGSLMPDGLTSAMSTQQRADLIALMLSLGRDDLMPSDKLDESIARARAHLSGPATFPLVREPIDVANWPNWQAHINRERIYDFYAKQAAYFRGQSSIPPLLAQAPSLDGDDNGHWGNQDDKTWADNRRNLTDAGSLQAGVVHGTGKTIPRGVCVHLGGDDAWSVCLNPESFQYELAWTGGFIKFSEVRSGLINGVMIDGNQQSIDVTSTESNFTPNNTTQYRGFFRHGDLVAFLYQHDGKELLDVPTIAGGKFSREIAPLQSHPLKWIAEGGPANWREAVQTKITLSETDSAYETDHIELPTENPWKSVFYLGGIAFDSNSNLYVCSVQGDVWRASGYHYPSTTATWKRFASGLHDALGMVIDHDGIFVLGRDQITRLHDLNDDGEADFYECFSSAMKTSPSGHDYICGLERDSFGNFYTASGNEGLLQISADGKNATVIATGFRNPDGLGLLPDGRITVPCSEGNWTPASMICLVDPNTDQPPYFGYPGPLDGKTPDLPMVYLPRQMDNSSGGQVYVENKNWGPLSNQLLHLSYGSASHFLVLQDSVAGQSQGAIVPLKGDFLSGVHRGRFSPNDGQLYVAGAAGWGNYAVEDGCLHRVRYTDKPMQVPTGFHVHQNGVRVQFALPLDPALAIDLKKCFAQVWNYRYGPGYGSPEFSTTHPMTPGHDSMNIQSVHLADDNRSLFIEIPDLQPVNQLHLNLPCGAGEYCDLFITVHALDKPFTDFTGYQATNKAVMPHPIFADVAMATRQVPNPWRKPIEGAREVRIECNSNLTFGTPSFKAKSGEAITVTLVNPDVVPHNWALLTPNSLEKIGNLANKYIADPDAPLRHYVPDAPEVLVYTDIVSPGSQFSISIKAPETPGRYPFLCTFPGHWSVMNGEMIVGF